jgi:peptidoglycan/LPS O-acetylase OafA/YrhL
MLQVRLQEDMNDQVWPKHLYAIDVSRGFAALSVVLWHWQHFFYEGNLLSPVFERENQPLYSVLRLFYEKGEMGVDYFFLLSGFIFFWLYKESIQIKAINLRTFWVQRFSRLYPLHVATLVLVALLQIIYTAHEGNSFVYPFNDAYHFLLNLGFASKWGFEKGWSFNAPVWSISIEILLYFIFFIVASRRLGNWFFCLTVSIVSFVILQFPHHPIFKGLTTFFLGGFIYYLTLLISTKYFRLKTVIYVTCTMCWLLVITHFYITDLSEVALTLGIIGKIFMEGFPYYILFPLTVCSLVLFEIDRGAVLKPISWVGDITYSSYLLHFPLQLLFGLALSYGVLNPTFRLEPMYLFIFFAILIPLSYFTFVKFERPMQKLIRAQFLAQPNKKPMQDS